MPGYQEEAANQAANKSKQARLGMPSALAQPSLNSSREGQCGTICAKPATPGHLGTLIRPSGNIALSRYDSMG